VQTTRTALPVGTGKSVEREVDLQLEGLMSWGRGWQLAERTAVYRMSLIDGSPVRREMSALRTRAFHLIYSILP